MRTQKGMVEQCKDQSKKKQRWGMGGRVQTRLTSRGNMRPVNSKRVVFKPDEKEIASRGNKRPVNSVSQQHGPIYITGGKYKQDIIANKTGIIILTVWEHHVNSLTEEECYKLENFVVCEYESRKYHSMSMESFKITPIPDIGEVDKIVRLRGQQSKLPVKCSYNRRPSLWHLQGTHVMQSRVEPLTPPLGRCSKADCAMHQWFDRCLKKLSAKLVVLHCPQHRPDI